MSTVHLPAGRGLAAGLVRPAPLPAVGVALVAAGGVLTGASGVLHLYLWGEPDGYRQVPTIGTLFLAQAVAAVVLGVLALSRRPLLVAAAAALMLATAAGFVVTVRVGLFGFRESADAPWAHTSLAVELAAAVLLGAGLLTGRHRRTSRGRTPRPWLGDA